jgi:hypothetical protein
LPNTLTLSISFTDALKVLSLQLGQLQWPSTQIEAIASFPWHGELLTLPVLAPVHLFWILKISVNSSYTRYGLSGLKAWIELKIATNVLVLWLLALPTQLRSDGGIHGRSSC